MQKCESASGNRTADQRLCFGYIDSAIPIISKSGMPSPEAVQPGLCRIWSEIPNTGFLVTRLKNATTIMH